MKCIWKHSESILKVGGNLPYRSEITELVEINRKRLSPKPAYNLGLRQTGERIKALFGKPSGSIEINF